MDERLIILNDQGGAVMDVSYEKTSTLRAQDHGHSPVVCLNFQGSKSNNVCTEYGTCYSINAMHGHDVHVVCFSIGSMNSKGMLSNNPNAGIHETDVARTIDANGSNPAGYQGGDVIVQRNDIPR